MKQTKSKGATDAKVTRKRNGVTWTVTVDPSNGGTMATFSASLTVDQYKAERDSLNAAKGKRGTIYVYTTDDDMTIAKGMVEVAMYAAADAFDSDSK